MKKKTEPPRPQPAGTTPPVKAPECPACHEVGGVCYEVEVRPGEWIGHCAVCGPAIVSVVWDAKGVKVAMRDLSGSVVPTPDLPVYVPPPKPVPPPKEKKSTKTVAKSPMARPTDPRHPQSVASLLGVGPRSPVTAAVEAVHGTLSLDDLLGF